jgi:hypothetical protein
MVDSYLLSKPLLSANKSALKPAFKSKIFFITQKYIRTFAVPIVLGKGENLFWQKNKKQKKN